MNKLIKNILSSICLALALVVFSPLGAATTYYVSPNGNDSRDGTTAETAFLTPAKAVGTAAAGDEIVLTEGLYPLTGELAVSKAVTIRGENRDTTILRAAPKKRGVTITAPGAVLSTLTVTDGDGQTKNPGANVYMNAAGLVTNCVLRNGYLSGHGVCGSGIYLEAGVVADTIITNNVGGGSLFNTAAGALCLKGPAVAERCLVAYNHSFCRGNAVVAPAGVLLYHASAVVRDCTIVRNAGQGIGGVYSQNAGGLVTNSIITENKAYRNLRVSDTFGGVMAFRGCVTDVEGLSSKTYTNFTGIVDFVDPEKGDWRPRLTSIAYRAGEASSAGAFPRIPTGGPECDFSAVEKKGIAPFQASFIAVATNFPSKALIYSWTFGDGAEPVVTTDPVASHEYLQPGRYDVMLEVSDGTEKASVTYRGEVVAVPPVLHVTDCNEGAMEPYDSWATAATNLQDAVDLAVDGCTILIDDVSLPIRNERSVLVTKGVTIRSRSGDPSRSAIGRYGTTARFRLLEFNHEDAVLSGLAIENGSLAAGSDLGGNMRLNMRGGTVTNCIIRNGTMTNQGSGGSGIGMLGGLVTHSVISNNYACGQTDMRGTGAIDLLGGTVESCLVTRNRSDASNSVNFPDVAGVSVMGGTLRNSTIVGNEAKTCGGVWIRESSPGMVVNCLVADNVSRSAGDEVCDIHGEKEFFSYCATRVPIEGAGEGCVSGEILFADPAKGDYAPAPGSIVIGKGLVEPWMASGNDLAGNPRLGDDELVDIGAYERMSTGLAASLRAEKTAGAVPLDVWFDVVVVDGVGDFSFAWDFDGDGQVDQTTSVPTASWRYTRPGSYDSSVTITDSAGQMTTARLVEPVSAAVAIAYVVPDRAFEGSEAPYESWATASTSIHDALAIAGHGTRVILKPGDYPITKQLRIEIGATLESETGVPEDVVIRRGGNDSLCLIRLNHPDSRLSGLTIADGSIGRDSGANVYVQSRGGTVTNCIIRNGAITWGNANTGAGIRLDAGLVTHCVITGNLVCAVGGSHTGGALGLHNDAVADTCLIAHNVCTSSRGTDVGSPAHIVGGTMRNCTIVDNVSSNGYGGIFYYRAGNQLDVPVVIENCLFARNRSLVDQAHSDLANNDALAKMSYCASDVDPGEAYAENCLHGPVPFKNAEKGDYRPVPPAVAIRSGLVTDEIAVGAVDLLGVPFLRPSDQADIGAYHGCDILPLILMLR